MRKKGNTILFFILVLAFLIGGPFLIIYSQGYRFDIEKLMFLETGGIYVKAYPNDVSISIDDKYENKTAAFSRDLLIQNLLPENHDVKVEKDGFIKWEKNLTVEKKKVAEAKYIILFPEEIPFTTSIEGVFKFFKFPNDNRLLLIKEKGLTIFNQDNNEETTILNEKQMINNIKDVVFSKTGKKLIIINEKGSHYLVNTDSKVVSPSLIKNFNLKTKNIAFDPNNDNLVFFELNNQIYKMNIDKRTTPQLFKKDKVESSALYGEIMYTLEKGDLIKSGILLGTSDKLTKTPFETSVGNSYEIIQMEGQIFIIENKKIAYMLKDGLFEKILESREDLKYSPFYDKILFVSNNEIRLLLLKDTDSPFFKKAGDLVFISRLSNKIDDIKWLNGEYFVFSSNNKAYISEIDNRDRINSFEIPNVNASQILFNGNSRKLIILNNNSLSISEQKIVP